MKYTKAFRLSIYKKMRKYIKDWPMNAHYLCLILKYDIKGNIYDIKDFEELMEFKPKTRTNSSSWWPDNCTVKTHNQYRIDALNKVIEEMTKSRKVNARD